MGFLDNVLKKVGASLATRYGVVASGKYEKGYVVLGNPPKEKVSVANRFSQLIIIKDNEEIARLDVNKDILSIEYIETIEFPATGNKGYRCIVTFANGDTCDIDLFPSKILIFYNNLRENMPEATCEFFEKEIKKSSINS